MFGLNKACNGWYSGWTNVSDNLPRFYFGEKSDNGMAFTYLFKWSYSIEKREDERYSL